MLLSLQAWAQVPPPAKPAPTPTPAPPAQISPQTAIEGPISEALQRYAAAMESRDADQVRKTYPTVDVDGLRRAFRDTRELKVSIDNVRVLSIEGAVARVSCRVVQAFTPKAGAKVNSTVTRVFRLRRQEAVWLIDAWER
jgi:ribosomal protein S12 methylthiotransferase accessory factor YcaO